MMLRIRFRVNAFLPFLMAGCLGYLAFFVSYASADTILLKNNKILKGLVVEQHADRIILSTEKGEIPILLTGVKEVQYSDPEQSYYQLGKSYESQNKLAEALAYYEKAIQTSPDFEEARTAAAGVRNRYWAESTEGPRDEVEKQQMIYESWKSGRTMKDLSDSKVERGKDLLKERLGLVVEKSGDWVHVFGVSPKKDADIAGLKKSDRLVAMDGASLRYLDPMAVTTRMLKPRYSSFTLEFERDVWLKKQKGDSGLSGLKLALKYQGVVVEAVEESSAADQAGIREQDLLVQIKGQSTRYTPLGTITKILSNPSGEKIPCTIRRSVILTRR